MMAIEETQRVARGLRERGSFDILKLQAQAAQNLFERMGR